MFRRLPLALAIATLVAALPSPQAIAAVQPSTYRCVVDVGGFTSNGYADSGDANNSTATINVGAGATLIAIGGTGSITAHGSSWLTEATVKFRTGTADTDLYFTPLYTQPSSGTASYNFDPPTDLIPLGFQRTVDGSGILRLEFFESTDDSGPNPDATWQSGSTIVFKYTGSQAAAGCALVEGEGPVEPDMTCAEQGYTGTKLTWCRNICENGYTGATLDSWIHRWVSRYRDLPYCAAEQGM